MSTQPNNPSDLLPEEVRRRLQASGPYGFARAVQAILEELGREYSFGSEVPEEYYRREGEGRGRYDEVEPCVVYRYRRYPVDRNGSSDGPSGARRQKTSDTFKLHDRPFPDEEEDAKKRERGQPLLEPLWDDRSMVPDSMDDIEADDKVYVRDFQFSVFVDFIVCAPTMRQAEQVSQDLLTILFTVFHKGQTGASRLAGFFYQDVPGGPPEVEDKLQEGTPCRTITWELLQTQSWAQQAEILEEIRFQVHGEIDDLRKARLIR